MQRLKPFKISASITDFLPLFSGLESVFEGLKTAGVDGVEMVIGVKSRWSAPRLLYLSRKYNLPISTVHQPIWSGSGLYIDNNFVKLAKDLGATDIVFHPLPFLSYKSAIMRNYFNKLAFLQKAYGITVMLENMSKMPSIRLKNKTYPDPKKSLFHMENLLEVAKEYDFKITYDISHGGYLKPHEQPWFEEIFPRLHNIHISSFDKKKVHLPLFMGDFDTQGFMKRLREKNYLGHLTFEIFYPWYVTLRKYDFSQIKKSVDIIHSVS